MKERLKAVRKKFNLTQEEFADRLGIKRGAISNYEIGRNIPIDAVLSLICREFGVNPEWLKTGTGEMMKAAPTDELDALAKKYHLRHKDYVLIEKIVGLSPQERDGIFRFMADVISASTENDINPDQVIFPDKIPDSESLEEEARAEAEQQTEQIYKQILAEKKAAAELLSESSEPKAGDGTAKQA